LEQITRTAPWRRITLHFSHIGLTDGRTFMIPFGVFGGLRALAVVLTAATTAPFVALSRPLSRSERDEEE
jgi:hypothetical protein